MGHGFIKCLVHARTSYRFSPSLNAHDSLLAEVLRNSPKPISSRDRPPLDSCSLPRCESVAVKRIASTCLNVPCRNGPSDTPDLALFLCSDRRSSVKRVPCIRSLGGDLHSGICGIFGESLITHFVVAVLQSDFRKSSHALISFHALPAFGPAIEKRSRIVCVGLYMCSKHVAADTEEAGQSRAA